MNTVTRTSAIILAGMMLIPPSKASGQAQVPWLVDSTVDEGVRSLTMVGSYGLVSIENGMLVMDFSVPSSPQWVSRLNLPPRWPFETLTGQFKIVVRGHYAFVPSWDIGFYIVDISNLSAPVVISQTSLPQSGAGRTVALYGDIAYVGGTKYIPGYIVDISNLQSPQEVGTLPFLDGGLFDAQIFGSLLYASSGHIYVVDLANPLAPAVIDTFPLVASCFAFAKSGSHVYAIDAYTGAMQGVGCFDVSNPSSPEFLGRLLTPGGDVAIAAVNDHAWVEGLYGGLYAVDMSDPVNPSGVICYPTGMGAPCTEGLGSVDPYGITIFDHYAFVSENISGLLAYTLQARGDVTADGPVNSSDIIQLVNHVFKSGPLPPSPTQSDTNCSGNLSASDVILLVNYVFKGSPMPVCP